VDNGDITSAVGTSDEASDLVRGGLKRVAAMVVIASVVAVGWLAAAVAAAIALGRSEQRRQLRH
jgi:hypothetical protein